MITRRQFAAAALASAATPYAFAQVATISKQANIVLGFPPGGSLDGITRLLAERLRGSYSANVVVENRAGAGGRIAMEVVKTANADGSFFTIIPASLMVIYPHVYKRLSYDPFKDFSAVSTVCTFQFGFSVGPAVPSNVRTIQDFAQWCKANPSRASFASPGEGTMAHFAGVMVGRAAGINLTQVPYKGGAPAIQDVVGGHISSSINVLSEPLPFAKEGRIRVLATTGSARSPFLPEAPTMREAGFPDLDIQEYFAAFLPAKTPASIISPLAGQIRTAISAPDLREAFASRAFQPEAIAGSDLERMLKADYDKWGPIVKSTGFSIDS